jgi:transcriptional regulator with XRE-family HTH domain
MAAALTTGLSPPCSRPCVMRHGTSCRRRDGGPTSWPRRLDVVTLRRRLKVAFSMQRAWWESSMSVSGEKIVALRNDLGWSQRKLSIISGISERTIQRVEQDGSTCSLETKLALAAAFDVPPQILSPIGDKPELADSASKYFAKLNAPHIGSLLLSGYLLVATGFNFQAALLVFVYAVVSLFILCFLISVCLYGLAASCQLLKDLRWHDRYPDNVSSLAERIGQARTFIVCLYVLGLLLPHAADVIANWVSFHFFYRAAGLRIHILNTVVPAGYFVVALVMAEFWVRPYKHRMERMLLVTR